MILSIIFRKDIVMSGLKVALIVGTILNLVNQGDLMTNLSFNDLDYTKILLTYIVPYAVSTYASVRVILMEQNS